MPVKILHSPEKQLKARVGPPTDGEVHSSSLDRLVISHKLTYHIELASSSQKNLPLRQPRAALLSMANFRWWLNCDYDVSVSPKFQNLPSTNCEWGKKISQSCKTRKKKNRILRACIYHLGFL